MKRLPKPSTKGIPENLKPLARKGQRVRFNGFWLSDSQQDRVVAAWLDETPQAGAIIKHLLYQMITGGTTLVVPPAPPSEYDSEIDIGEAGSALLDFDD